MDALGQRGENDGVLPRTSGGGMIGDLVRCKWLVESLCIIKDREERKLSARESYYICRVYDFMASQVYWVDEEDLIKV